jgi:hypothetical protein
VPGVDRAIDGCGEDDSPALLQTHEVVAPIRVVRREARLRYGDEASALGQARQGRRNVPQRRVGPAPVDVGQRRERRVHQDDGRTDARIEVIVDLGRIEPGHADIRKEMREQAGPVIRQLVDRERGGGQLGKDGEQAGAG